MSINIKLVEAAINHAMDDPSWLRDMAIEDVEIVQITTDQVFQSLESFITTVLHDFDVMEHMIRTSLLSEIREHSSTYVETHERSLDGFITELVRPKFDQGQPYEPEMTLLEEFEMYSDMINQETANK